MLRNIFILRCYPKVAEKLSGGSRHTFATQELAPGIGPGNEFPKNPKLTGGMNSPIWVRNRGRFCTGIEQDVQSHLTSIWEIRNCFLRIVI